MWLADIDIIKPNRAEARAIAAHLRQASQSRPPQSRPPQSRPPQPDSSATAQQQPNTASASLTCTDGVARGQLILDLDRMACQWATEWHPGGAAAAQRLEDAITDVVSILYAGVPVVLLTLGPDGCCLCTLGDLSSKRTASGPQAAVSTGPPRDVPKVEVAGLEELKGLRGRGRQKGEVMGVQVCLLPAVPCNVVNVSGAGDCLLAGMLCGLLQGRSLLHAMAMGVLAARLACESDKNVPAELQLMGAGGMDGEVDTVLGQVVHLEWSGS
jgi:hypothetical protein